MKSTPIRDSLAVSNGWKYAPLMLNLVARDLKKKYRASFLGYAWCVLNPLLIMIIMTIVFSRMFSHSIENYPIYFFTGRMMYVFVTSGAGAVMKSLVGNAALMRKTRVPYYMFPFSAFLTALVDFLFNLVAFAIVMLFTGTPVNYRIIAFPSVILQASLFTFGFGLLLAIANIYFRDIQYLYAAFTTAWMYLTPLFYPLTSLPEGIQGIIQRWNPLYFFVEQTRSIFLDRLWPNNVTMIKGYAVGLIFMALGLILYNRVKKNMMLYL